MTSTRTASEQRILRVGPVNPTVAAALSSEFDALVLPDSAAERDSFLGRHAEQVTSAVCSGKVGVDRELLARLPNLKAIISFGAGYDATDVVGARERGIQISNTPEVLTDCVADVALALYLDTLRGISRADRFVRSGAWSRGENFPLMTRANRKRVGILGLGRIGKAIATRLESLGVEIHYHNRQERPQSGYQYHSSPARLADAVDVLVVAAAGGPESTHLVSAEVLGRLGEDGYIINIARGSVVDEAALVAALKTRRIAGAGLDVFAHEPHVPEKLFELDNVVLLPHLGSGTVETRADMAELTLQNLRGWLESGQLVSPVN